MNIYAIYDKLAEQWSNPFVLDNRVAERTFRWMTKERSEADCEDKVIYKIGVYNETIGEIVKTSHEMVYDIESQKAKEKPNG